MILVAYRQAMKMQRPDHCVDLLGWYRRGVFLRWSAPLARRGLLRRCHGMLLESPRPMPWARLPLSQLAVELALAGLDFIFGYFHLPDGARLPETVRQRLLLPSQSSGDSLERRADMLSGLMRIPFRHG